MANILLVSHWVGGDILPFIRMGVYLKKQGHQVRVFSHYGYKDWADEAGLNFTAWESEQEYQQLQVAIPDFLEPFTQPQQFEAFRNQYLSPERRLKEFNIMAKWAGEPDTVIIGRCRSSIAAMHLSEVHKVPYINVYLAPSNLSYMTLINQSFKALADLEINELRSELGLSIQSTWMEYQCSVPHSLALWSRLPEWNSEISGQLTPEAIGFPLPQPGESDEIPDNIAHFLSEYPSPILITGGTSQLISKDFYRIAIEACERLNRAAIVATEHDHLLPNTLPSKVLRARRLPFDKVFPHCSLVIHHGGIGSTAQCLASGVPQLVMAHMTDGPDNARRVESLGVGRFLPQSEWNAETLRQSIDELSSGLLNERCIEVSHHINQEQPFSAINRLVETLVFEKSGYVSPPELSEKRSQPESNSVNLAIKRKINKRALLERRLKANN
ncbi:putative UDP-glucuronosyl/UDP-glucosyltransferase [Vibrio nigripulchritudo SOn1]|uniref:UDP-glucuronosyl/UDP-glucosyltransferase n=1 Tax=Vibrio nigripulchritudo SOn1 TaxID=1238450 RepID=A0AAV2VVN8_9VIBR|nr:nucleotide disphospho-sugar-binding domain-containing protein [Vibrio nigripulchritudo]CCO48804.1 putative UDP-glucuronosyl/UDP-glucosyltransferase [Vibrio nigripulchritudo SOn1]